MTPDERKLIVDAIGQSYERSDTRRLIAALDAAPSWRIVANVPPPQGTLLLCCDKGAQEVRDCFWVAWFVKGDWIERNALARRVPTHWMPLPEWPQ